MIHVVGQVSTNGQVVWGHLLGRLVGSVGAWDMWNSAIALEALLSHGIGCDAT